MAFLATINTPGYLPNDVDPPVFETKADAWAYLAAERRSDEESAGDGTGQHWPDCPWDNASPYTETVEMLAELGDPGKYVEGTFTPDGEPGNYPANAIGMVLGDTPGDCNCTEHQGTEPYQQNPHDLGLAYSVTESEDPA
jgi:hypothetical protein